MDAWAALRTGTGVDPQGRRADPPVRHRGRGLDRQAFLPQRGIEPTATLGEHCWQHNMRRDSIHLDRGAPADIHHGQVGPQPATDLCIGAGPRMFQEFHRP